MASVAQAGLSASEVAKRLSPASLSDLSASTQQVFTAELCECVPASTLDESVAPKVVLWAIWECGRPGAGRASVAHARAALLWTRLALQYDLAPAKSLSALVEPLMTTLVLNKNLRAIASDLLCSVVGKKDVTSWRVRALSRLNVAVSSRPDRAAVAAVVERFAILRPELMPKVS
jgi:hypothetical protein